MPDLINPYIAGNPVTGDEMFFGREDIFDFIRQTLTGKHRDQVIVLYGQRRTGKTSILYQLHRHLDPRYLCIFVDLHGLLMESEAAFLWELAGQIRRVLSRDHGIDLTPPDRAAFLTDARSYFANDFLDQAWQVVGDRHILLMIDEAVRLQEQVAAGKLDKSIFEYLRHLMQHYDRLNFLFSIGSGLEQMEKEYAFLFNVALYKKISFLERSAAVELVTQPVHVYYEVDEAALDRILKISACHPYYTQLLCHSLFNRWQRQGGNSIGTDDVEAVMEEVVERGLAVLKHTWEDSTPGEKAVIAGLAAAMGENNRPVERIAAVRVWEHLEVTLPADETVRALKSLAARDIITGEEQVEFTVDLLHLWVRKFQRLEWVEEEIRPDIEKWHIKQLPWQQAVQMSAEPEARVTKFKPALVLLAAGVILAIAVLFAAILDWGPFDRGATEDIRAGTGFVVPGGDALLVNDLAVAGGAVWAATDRGLVRWTADGQAISISGDEFGFPDPFNQTVAVAEDGSLWIGGGGVSHVEPVDGGIRFLDYYDRDSELGMSVVRVLMTENGVVWAGGNTANESPLSRFDGESWDYDAISLDGPVADGVDPSIWSLLHDTDGNLWAGLIADGILRWDGERWSHWGAQDGVGSPGGDGGPEPRVRGLVQDDRGDIWAAAGERGLMRFAPESESWEPVEVAEITNWATAISFFDDGSLWVGQEDGTVIRTEDYGATWAVVASPDDNLGEDITALVQDETGSVWASSYGGGVSVWTDGEWQNLQR
jgi:hypothetical protein